MLASEFINSINNTYNKNDTYTTGTSTGSTEYYYDDESSTSHTKIAVVIVLLAFVALCLFCVCIIKCINNRKGDDEYYDIEDGRQAFDRPYHI